MSNTIGRNIKKYRKKKGYTQGMLSRKSGVYDGAISKYELGKTKPREDNLIKIADALEIPCNYLLEGVYDVVLKKPLSRDDSKDDINGETDEHQKNLNGSNENSDSLDDEEKKVSDSARFGKKEEYERSLNIIYNLDGVEADGNITVHGKFVNAICDMYNLIDEIFREY